jgi:Uma2 family endonuclease
MTIAESGSKTIAEGKSKVSPKPLIQPTEPLEPSSSDPDDLPTMYDLEIEWEEEPDVPNEFDNWQGEDLPTMYDLPSESAEEPGVPDEFHDWQAELCSVTFNPPGYPKDQVLAAADLNLYYNPDRPGWHKRPDWFGVVGVSRFYQGKGKPKKQDKPDKKELRLSYVVWYEKVLPVIVIEFLSRSTHKDDLGQKASKGKQPTKWQVYEQILQIPYYVTFDRRTDEMRVFCLDDSDTPQYQEQIVADSRFWFPRLEMGLGLWQGEYRGIDRLWLRWYDVEGNWIPTEAEQERLRAEQERLRAEQERLRAEQERLRAEQERLRAEQADQRAEQARLRAEQANQRAEQERQRSQAIQQELEQEQQRADRLAEQLRRLGIDPNHF